MGLGTGTVGRVAVDFVLNHEAFDTGLRLVEDKVRSTVGSIAGISQRLDRALTSIGTRLTLGITVPVAGAGVALAKVGASFDQTMTRIGTLAGATEGEIEEFRAAVLRLSPALAQSPSALGEALLAITSRGPRGAQALDVLERSAKASTVGLGETAVVAGLVSSALAAYAGQNLTAARATDVLLAGVRAGAAEADQMAAALGPVLGIASQLGVSFEEVVAFVATFTKLGVSADESVTALRGALSTVLSPSQQAEEALRGVGLSAEVLRAQLRNPGLNEAFIGLVDAFRGNEEGLANIIENVRALSGVLGTAGAQANTYRQIIGEVTHGTGLVDRTFARTAATPAFTFRQFRVEAEATATAIGNRLAPAFASLLRAVNPLISIGGALLRAFTALPIPIQSTVIALGAMVVAAGPLILLIQGLVKAVGALIAVTLAIRLGPVLLQMARAAAPAVRGILSLRSAIAALPSPIASAASLALTLVSALHPLGLVIGPLAALAARLVSMTPTMRVLGLAALAFGATIGGVGIATKGLSSASGQAAGQLAEMGDRIEEVGKKAEDTRTLIQRLNDEANKVGSGQPTPTPYVPPPTAIPPPIGGFYVPPGTPGAPTPTPTPPAPVVPLSGLGAERERPAGPFVGPLQRAPRFESALDTVGADNSEVAKIFREARQELQGLENAAKLLPPTFDLAGAKASVIETALKNAGKAGLRETSKEGRDLAAQLSQLAGSTVQFDRQLAAIDVQAGLTGDSFGAWQQQVAALESQIAQFRADGLAGPAAELEQRLYELLDAGPPVEAELAKIAAQGEAVGPTFDTAGRSISFLRGAMENLAAQGVGPTSDVIVLMQREVARLSGDTGALVVQLNAATQTGVLFGDRQGALQEQVRTTQGRLREMVLALEQAKATLGDADPAVIALAGDVENLARVYRALNAELRQTEEISAARAALEGYDRELVAIGQRASIFRNAGLEGGDLITQLEARARAGREAIDKLTSPTDLPATPQEAQARQASVEAITVDVQGAERSIRVAGAIQGAFETAADGISSAFDRSVLGIIQGTTTIGQAAALAGQSIALELASSAVKAGTAWVAKQAQMLAIEAATQAGLISLQEGGSGVRQGLAIAESQAISGAKGVEVAEHALAEGAKTAATATGSTARQGWTFTEVATAIGAKAAEVAGWVAGEAAKLAASIATFAVAIAGTLQLAAVTIALGAALAAGLVSMIGVTIAAPILGIVAALATPGLLALATALKAVAIAGAASAVASIPYVGPILAVAAASTVAGVVSGLAAVPIVTAARGALLSHDQLVQAHAGEAILPAALTRGIRGIVAVVPELLGLTGGTTADRSVPSLGSRPRPQVGRVIARAVDGSEPQGAPDSAGGRQFVFAPVIQAWDRRDVERMLRRHGSELTEVLAARFRDYDPNLRRAR